MALAVECNNNTAASLPWLTPTKRAIEGPCSEQRRKAISSSPQTMHAPKDPSRKVTFSKKVRVVEFFIRKSENEQENTPSWYTKADYKTFQKDRTRNMHALRLVHGDTSAIDGTLFCLRGLEDHVSVSTRQEKTLRKISLVQAVLDEQKRQRMVGVIDDNALCAVSTIMSEFGRRRARDFGIDDANENHFLVDKMPPVKAVPLLAGVANPRLIQKFALSA